MILALAFVVIEWNIKFLAPKSLASSTREEYCGMQLGTVLLGIGSLGFLSGWHETI